MEELEYSFFLKDKTGEIKGGTNGHGGVNLGSKNRYYHNSLIFIQSISISFNLSEIYLYAPNYVLDRKYKKKTLNLRFKAFQN